MQIVWSLEDLPRHTKKIIFLAGPTPRSKKVKSWRPEALKILKKLGYDGHVFVPESKNGRHSMTGKEYKKQCDWETAALNIVDVIIFWVPRDLKTMPALTTNIEWGIWANSGKSIFGAPSNAPKNEYLKLMADNLFVPRFNTLEKTIKKAVEIIGDGAERFDGECEVPLHIWKTKTFQDWYQNLINADNSLKGAKILWSRQTNSDRSTVLSWILKPDIWIGKEKRLKTKEPVFSRFDISAAMLWRKNKDDILKSEIVLVKEFRSPGRTRDGFIHELPGGSSLKDIGKRELASTETLEETGFGVEPQRWKEHGSRQLAGTLSTHHAHLFSLQITKEEITWFKKKAERGLPEGNAEESERTYVEVKTIKQIVEEKLVDFSTLGMIFEVININ